MGNRLLDVIAMLKASRSIAMKHLALRRHYFDTYGKTSSLAKTTIAQADKVTQKIKAASALTERFNGPRYSTKSGKHHEQGPTKKIPSPSSIDGGDISVRNKSGIEQDHFYNKSKKNTTAQPLSNSNIEIQQEKSKNFPLPDGSINPIEHLIGSSSTYQDTFSASNTFTATSSSTPVGSETDKEGAEKQNVDIKQSIPDTQAIPEQDEPTDEMYTDIFHSPRVAKLLKKDPKQPSHVQGLDLRGVQATPIEEDKLLQKRDQESFNTRLTGRKGAAHAVSADKQTNIAQKPQDSEIHKPPKTTTDDHPDTSSSQSNVSIEIYMFVISLLID